MKVLIFVAMQSELEGFLNKVEYETILVNGSKVHTFKVNDNIIYLSKCEVGKVNAAMLTTSLILKLKPQFVINAGIAGGLNPSINLLDVIASTKVAYHDFDLTPFGLKKGEMDNNMMYFKGSLKLLKLCKEDVKKGLIVSGDQFVSGLAANEEIKKNFPKALACDMEGCAIAHVASLLSKKFLVIRCISDNVFLKEHTKVYYDYKYQAIDKVANYVLEMLSNLN